MPTQETKGVGSTTAECFRKVWIRPLWKSQPLWLLCLTLILPSCAEPRLPELIPQKIIFGNPEKAAPQISPDGTRLAYIAPYNDVLNIWVQSLFEKGDDKLVTQDEDRGIIHFFWGGDSEHILYIQDKKGDENWRFHSVNVETGEVTDLTPFKKVQVRLIGLDKNFPDEVYIAMNKRDKRLHDLYHLNWKTGELNQVIKNPGNHVGWIIDADFKVRGAMTISPQGYKDIYFREKEGSDWRLLIRWKGEDADSSHPVSFSKDNRYIYLQDSRDSNTTRLVKMEIATGDTEVLVEDPDYDLASIMIHPDTHEIQIVAYQKARREWVILDETIRNDIERIQKLHPGDFFITNRDYGDRYWIVGFTSDAGSVPYYVYDRKKKKADFLFYSRPELNRYRLAPMEPIEFESRDGLLLQGYITFPGGVGKKNLPMVVRVHGGPWSRDVWGYDSQCQWLANRGYICLQINYRGSTGYGKKFLNAGNKEWGGKMQEDLVDGVHWAIRMGYADPERIAIYGTSYGGYAALMGVTSTPELFACAVSVVGPSNLLTFLKSVPPYWELFLQKFYTRVGNPETEVDFLKARSPLFHVDKIQVPVLIAHGANDPRVKQEESEQIVKAMEAKGIDYEYLLFPDEGHGFLKQENRLTFFAAADKFLAKHLGGRFEGELS